MTGLVDVHGMPLRRDVLTREVAAPTLAGVRQPEAGYPADGLTPMRLGNILRAADQGDPLAYLELAEQIEERDLHYLGVLGTRKRAVTQIEVTVEAASDDPDDVAIADMVRDWLDRDELADEMFDMLDAIGKHSSFTEIIWDRSEGQWQPARLEWRDPRFFTFDRKDGTTPLLRGGEAGNGQDTPLPPFKFIHHRVKAKSGLPMRSGLARAVAWAWMFKAYTLRDWAIFAQTYGQPVRIGKFDSNASKEDRMTLWRAVANIAGDCAAIIPQGMSIDFVESGNVGAGSDLYERRADWFDRQTSKAVLGQTGTTDTKQGGLGDGGNKVHGEVKNDIKKSDGRGLAGSLNRDLVRPWVDLERGPRKAYPRVRIEEREPEDVNGLANALDKLVDLGLEVQQSEVRDKLGLSDPDPGSKLLRPRVQAAPAIERVTSPTLSLQSAQSAVASPAAQITDQLARVTEPEMRGMLGELALMMQAATSLPELREMIVSAWPRLDAGRLVEQLAGGLTAARAAGMSDIEDADA